MPKMTQNDPKPHTVASMCLGFEVLPQGGARQLQLYTRDQKGSSSVRVEGGFVESLNSDLFWSIWEHMGSIWGAYGEHMGRIWEHMGAYGSIWEHMGGYMMLSGTIWGYVMLSGVI